MQLPVIMESTIRNTREWDGEIGGALCTKLYVDFADTDVNSDLELAPKCEELILQLKALPALKPYAL